MNDYELMPVEATPEMEQAAEKYWYERKFKALSDDPRTWKGVYAAMRSAAPAVQGEPPRQYYYKVNSCKALSPDSDQCICWHYEGEGPLADGSAKSWRVAPIKPAEQQPLRSNLALDAATHLTNWLDMNWCECEGGHTCGYNDVKRTRDALLVAAEQPDVTQLVEALEEISDPIRFMGERLKEGERLNGMAAVQLAGDASYLRGIAIAALAAHRKQGGE